LFQSPPYLWINLCLASRCLSNASHRINQIHLFQWI
jgi:hypothetical protein